MAFSITTQDSSSTVICDFGDTVFKSDPIQGQVTLLSPNRRGAYGFAYTKGKVHILPRLEQVKCPPNVTHLASCNYGFAVLTRDKELYLMSDYVMNATDLLTLHPTEQTFKAIGWSISSPIAVGVCEDNKLWMLIVGTLNTTIRPMEWECPGLGDKCNLIHMSVGDRRDLVVVWDENRVFYVLEGVMCGCAPLGGKIKSCAMNQDGEPIVLLSDGRVIDVMSGGFVNTGCKVVGLSMRWYNREVVVQGVSESGECVPLYNAEERGIEETVTMGNCPLTPSD